MHPGFERPISNTIRTSRSNPPGPDSNGSFGPISRFKRSVRIFGGRGYCVPTLPYYRVQTDVSGKSTAFFRSLFGSSLRCLFLLGWVVPFGCISPIMVRRADKAKKFKRWQFYRPMQSKECTWKKTLQNVIGKGRVKIRFLEISRHRVELQ